MAAIKLVYGLSEKGELLKREIAPSELMDYIFPFDTYVVMTGKCVKGISGRAIKEDLIELLGTGKEITISPIELRANKVYAGKGECI